MEKKKTKLTISGSPKKSFKDLGSSKSQGKKTVIIERQSSRSPSKGGFTSNLQINLLLQIINLDLILNLIFHKKLL